MFIAHLPAGYLLSKAIQKKFNNSKYLWLGLLGSVFPDLDLFYFYLINKRQTAHHEYWSHIPFLWLLIGALTFLAIKISKKDNWNLPAILFFVGIFSHMVLDSIAAPIHWLYPFYTQDFQLIDVPSVYSWWVLNFILHWSFLLEIAICALAGFVFIKELRCWKLKNHISNFR